MSNYIKFSLWSKLTDQWPYCKLEYIRSLNLLENMFKLLLRKEN